jgi:AcrR family transcriptional regulator
MSRLPLNARSQRTRGALRRAFATLLPTNRYENLEVTDVTALAGISRSTFYTHYSGLDALLADSIAVPFATLADTILPSHLEPQLVALLEHFWENRFFARGILTGNVRRKTLEVLIRLIAARLRAAGLYRRGALVLPPKLAAIQLAEILLAPTTAWLLGESRCSSRTLAIALRRTSVSALESLLTRP